MVDDHPMRQSAKESLWLAQRRDIARRHESEEGVMCQVRCLRRVAQPPSEPAQQPAVVRAVNGFDGGSG